MTVVGGNRKYLRYFIATIFVTCTLFIGKSYFCSAGAPTLLVFSSNSFAPLLRGDELEKPKPLAAADEIDVRKFTQIFNVPIHESSTISTTTVLSAGLLSTLTTLPSPSTRPSETLSTFSLPNQPSSTLSMLTTLLPSSSLLASTTSLPTEPSSSLPSQFSNIKSAVSPTELSSALPTSTIFSSLNFESSSALLTSIMQRPLSTHLSSTFPAFTILPSTSPTVALHTINMPPSTDVSSSTPVMLSSTLPITSRYILAVEPVGRYGNQMFQFASAYGIAKHKQRQLISRGHYEIANFFILEFVEEVNDTVTYIRDLPRFGEKGCCSFSSDLYNLVGRDTQPGIMLNGYFQSWMYFKDYFTDIRRMFTSYQPTLANQISRFYASIASESLAASPGASEEAEKVNNSTTGISNNKTIFVGVHVRRGDMKVKYFMDYGFSTGGTDFIGQAMLYFVKRFSHVTFIVCSDDIEWCRKHIIMPEIFRKMFTVHFCHSEDSPLLHLGILSSCNHSIITGGTFGWWGAFLAGGETVYYKGYPRLGTQLAKGFSESKSDYYLPGWIAM